MQASRIFKLKGHLHIILLKKVLFQEKFLRDYTVDSL